MTRQEQSKATNNQFWYLLLATIVGMLALAGYAGYILYPRFDLPAVTGIGLLVLAVGAGVAAFFSPCSFPLLVTLLGRESQTGAEDRRMRLMRSMYFGSALAVGAVVFLGLTGLGIALGASALFGDVTFTSTVGRALRLTVGGLLILLGLIQFGVIQAAPFDPVHRVSAPLMRRQAALRQSHATFGFAMYGFIYILAGFGWTGPILAGLVGYSMTVGGLYASLAAFGVAALTMVIMIFLLAVLIGTAQGTVTTRLRAEAPQIKRWGGAVVIVVGIWLAAIGIWANFFATIFPV